MPQFTISEHIVAPPEVVFEVAHDFHRAAEHIQGIESCEVLTDGPIGVGTRFRETRIMFGKPSTEEMEITAFDPPHSFVLESDSCGAHFSVEHRFVGDISGTNVRMNFDTRPQTFLAKLFSPLGWLMIKSMKKLVAADLADLKRVAEQRAREL